jgi:hypothetical protein
VWLVKIFTTFLKVCGFHSLAPLGRGAILALLRVRAFGSSQIFSLNFEPLARARLFLKEKGNIFKGKREYFSIKKGILKRAKKGIFGYLERREGGTILDISVFFI